MRTIHHFLLTRRLQSAARQENVEMLIGRMHLKAIWLRHILPRLNTTHAFVNVGWEKAPGQEISCELQEFEESHPEIKTFMISNAPYRNNVENPSVSFDPKSLKCNSNFLDRTTMNKIVPSAWYWDKVHVSSILNEAYNHLTIEKFCPIKEWSTVFSWKIRDCLFKILIGKTLLQSNFFVGERWKTGSSCLSFDNHKKNSLLNSLLQQVLI